MVGIGLDGRYARLGVQACEPDGGDAAEGAEFEDVFRA